MQSQDGCISGGCILGSFSKYTALDICQISLSLVLVLSNVKLELCFMGKINATCVKNSQNC